MFHSRTHSFSALSSIKGKPALFWHVYCLLIDVRIAVPEFLGRVSPILEQSRNFVIFTVDEGKIVGRERASNPDPSLAGLLEFLKEKKVDLMLCGSLLPQTFHLLSLHNIAVIWGAVGGIDEAISSFLAGVIPYPPPARKRWRWGKRKKWR